MDSNQIKKSLKVLVPLKQPVFIWGAPGVGKSQVVRSEERRVGKEC